MSIWLRLRNLVLKETTNMSLYETHKLLHGIHILCIVVTLNIFMVLPTCHFSPFQSLSGGPEKTVFD